MKKTASKSVRWNCPNRGLDPRVHHDYSLSLPPRERRIFSAWEKGPEKCYRMVNLHIRNCLECHCWQQCVKIPVRFLQLAKMLPSTGTRYPGILNFVVVPSAGNNEFNNQKENFDRMCLIRHPSQEGCPTGYLLSRSRSRSLMLLTRLLAFQKKVFFIKPSSISQRSKIDLVIF